MTVNNNEPLTVNAPEDKALAESDGYAPRPQRRCRLVLTIEADSQPDLKWSFEEVSMHIFTDGVNESMMGGCSSSWSYKVTVNEEQTPEKYRAQLQDYLAHIKA